MQERLIFHGDIRPINIFLSEEGEIKLLDHGLLNLNKNSQIKMINCNEKCYPSPEVLHCVKQKNFTIKYNPHKSDVFSMGMTLLHMICLDNVEFCYNYSECMISAEIIQKLLNFTEKKYSRKMKDFLELILNFDENTRPDFLQIYKILSPYKVHIENLRV